MMVCNLLLLSTKQKLKVLHVCNSELFWLYQWFIDITINMNSITQKAILIFFHIMSYF